jgi:hypothetical protein
MGPPCAALFTHGRVYFHDAIEENPKQQQGSEKFFVCGASMADELPHRTSRNEAFEGQQRV